MDVSLATLFVGPKPPREFFLQFPAYYRPLKPFWLFHNFLQLGLLLFIVKSILALSICFPTSHRPCWDWLGILLHKCPVQKKNMNVLVQKVLKIAYSTYWDRSMVEISFGGVSPFQIAPDALNFWVMLNWNEKEGLNLKKIGELMGNLLANSFMFDESFLNFFLFPIEGN